MKEESGILKPRPYARLLTMIGDQLIKNEKIALIELIKNAYDADANWVQVRFVNFEQEKGQLVQSLNSLIEIEDDGEGMTIETIRDSWMNPAAPNKFLQKEGGKIRTERKRRIIQGEKGIGRYAIYKIGRSVELITRHLNGLNELVLKNDLSIYDDEVISEKADETNTPRFLDEVNYSYETRLPQRIVSKEIVIREKKLVRNPYGTVIVIKGLRNIWTNEKIKEIMGDISRLNFPFEIITGDQEFTWDFKVNERSVVESGDEKNELERLFERAPIRLTGGVFDDRANIFTFDLNGENIELSIERMKANREFRNHFCDKKTGELRRKPACGPFEFRFYVFDLTDQAPAKYHLDDKEDSSVKSHRIYLYRDGVRVFPYGDPSDDWLGIDVLRGTGRAGDYLSNDQTIGYVKISREQNPNLKDKTNREGLLEIGNSFADFRVLIQSLLGYLHSEYKKYKIKEKKKKTIFSFRESALQIDFDNLIKHLVRIKDGRGKKLGLDLLRKYNDERNYLVERASTTEDLAAVGLTVEAASHDLMMMMNRALVTLQHVTAAIGADSMDKHRVMELTETLRKELDFISYNIEGIQPIFRSSKRAARTLDIRHTILDVRKYYTDLLEKNSISLTTELIGDSLKVHTTEAVLLQTFINLLDNAVYWLTTVDRKDKQIQITIDHEKRRVIFADNGPGVGDDDLPFIFEPFFSTKGVAGRGLGLYIARQLLERNNFAIDYLKTRKILPGANFVISFTKD